MRTVGIDFSRPSLLRALLRSHPAALAAAVAGACLCATAAVPMREVSQQQASLQAELRAAEARQNMSVRRKPEEIKPVVTESRAKSINAAVQQLNLPWHMLLNAVEEATPESIALLSLEPDGKKQVLKGEAEAKNPEDMLGYVERLKQQAFFSGVVLSRHEINEQDANRPVRFQFEAQWRSNP